MAAFPEYCKLKAMFDGTVGYLLTGNYVHCKSDHIIFLLIIPFPKMVPHRRTWFSYKKLDNDKLVLWLASPAIYFRSSACMHHYNRPAFSFRIQGCSVPITTGSSDPDAQRAQPLPFWRILQTHSSLSD